MSALPENPSRDCWSSCAGRSAILGLAAQQTLGNLFAGVVLVSARPFGVGERLRLQAGGLAGEAEGVVSSLGLLYTTLARRGGPSHVPNSVVLGAAVVPLREPDAVDVSVRLGHGMRPTQVQAILDERITTPTRAAATVLIEEIDGDNLVVRIRATPEIPGGSPPGTPQGAAAHGCSRTGATTRATTTPSI
jgi:small conductance mechanosensitive channel